MIDDYTTHDIDLDRIYPKDRLRYEGKYYRVQSIRRTKDSSKPYEIEIKFVIIYEDRR